jgi:hypothetical protein
MTRLHEATAFQAKPLLPAAEYAPAPDIAAFCAPREVSHLRLESPRAVRALENARWALAQVEPTIQAVSLPWGSVAGSSAVAAPPGSANLIQLARPTALAWLRVQDAGVWYDTPLFEAATPFLPEPAALGAGFAGVPVETECLNLGLPDSVRGKRSVPVGAGQFSLAGSSFEPLLPAWSEAPALPGLLELAPLSPAGLPSPVRPTPITRALARDSAPASFQVTALPPEVPERAPRLEMGAGDFSPSPLVPVVRSAAPRIAGGRVPLSPAEPFQVLPVAAPDLECSVPVPQAIPGATEPAAMAGQFARAVAPGPDFAPEPQNIDAPRGTEVRVPKAEYAPSHAVLAMRPKSSLLSVGPVNRESEILLLSDGTLAKTNFLAPAVGVFGPPRPITGAFPHGLADFTPSVPAAADPQLASVALPLAEQVAVPSSDLQWFGAPAVRKRPAQPRALPHAEMPAADLSMVGLAAPTARHTIEEMAILPTSITATAREPHLADSLRQDLPIPEAHLPALGSPDREHLLGTAPAFQAPLVAVPIQALPYPPAGFVSRKLSAELPASIAFSAALSLSAGEPSRLGVPAATWTSDSHSLGWAAFPPNEVLVSDSRAAAIGVAMVVSLSGLEALERPLPKTPLAASPLATQTAFPLAEPIQPATADAEVSHTLQAVPPAMLAPAVFRGTPQAPWKTSAEILAQPVGLPFGLGISARLYVAGQDLEAPAPARVLGAAARSDARRVAAPISLSDEIRAPDLGLSPIHPLVFSSTGILAGLEFHAPRQVAAGFKPAARTRFRTARPRHAQSEAIEACHTLDQSPPWAGAGHTRLGTLRVSDPALVGLVPRTAELAEALPTALAFHRLAARWDKVSGLETLQRPLPKAPRAASPLATQTAFPLAEPIQPATADAEVSHTLQAVPPATLAPAVFRGAPQAPWKTSAEILAQPVGLPGFDLGISARLYVAGQDLEAPAPARALGAAALSDAHRVAAPISLSDEIHAPDLGLSPIHPLAISSTGILAGLEFHAPRQVAAGFKPAARARFRTARPRHAQSEAIEACHTLDQSPPWAGAGRTRLGTLRVSDPALVGLVPRTAEPPGAMPVALAVHLMGSGSERVPPRTHAGAPSMAVAGWQTFEGDCTSQHFQSIESSATSLQWPTPASGWFQTEAKRAPFAGAFPIAPPRGTEFPRPEAIWPQSAGFTEVLRPTHLAALGAPPKCEDTRTARQSVHLEPVFRPIRRPARLPVFSRATRKAEMPSGVFLYVEAHEDFEDYGTMGIAPHYEAPLLEPAIPATRHTPSIRGNLELARLSLSAAPRLDLPAGPAGASGVQVTPPSPLLRDEVDPIPLEFDSEAAKGQGIMGALKNASRFFKFTTLTLFGVLLLWPQMCGVPKVYGNSFTPPVANGGLVSSVTPESLSYGEDSAPRAELSS